MDQEDVAHIARVAHEVNRAYCESIGDTSQVPWEDAPDWQRERAIKGVRFHLDHPEATPEDSHKSWLEEKARTGWKYGPEKSENQHTHPCIKPYAELPQEQRSKDYLFRAVVHALGGKG